MGPGSTNKMAIRAIFYRVTGALLVMTWGAYMFGLFRTQEFGFSLAALAVSLLFVLPAASLPFVGLRWKALVAGTLALVAGAVGVGEGVAASEEAAFRRQLARQNGPLNPVVKDRAWPFSNHYMYFNPVNGKFGAGD